MLMHILICSCRRRSSSKDFRRCRETFHNFLKERWVPLLSSLSLALNKTVVSCLPGYALDIQSHSFFNKVTWSAVKCIRLISTILIEGNSRNPFVRIKVYVADYKAEVLYNKNICVPQKKKKKKTILNTNISQIKSFNRRNWEAKYWLMVQIFICFSVIIYIKVDFYICTDFVLNCRW